MRLFISIILLFIACSTAWAQVDVDPEKVTFSQQTFVVMVIVTIFAVLGNIISGFFNWLRSRAAQAEDKQTNRLDTHDAEITSIKLSMTKAANSHQQKLHNLELKLAECRTDVCGRQSNYVTRDIHDGDMLRVQNNQTEQYQQFLQRMDKQTEKLSKDISDGLRKVHSRIDEFLNNQGQGQAKTKKG